MEMPCRYPTDESEEKISAMKVKMDGVWYIVQLYKVGFEEWNMLKYLIVLENNEIPIDFARIKYLFLTKEERMELTEKLLNHPKLRFPLLLC
jgi:hypothetical protein